MDHLLTAGRRYAYHALPGVPRRFFLAPVWALVTGCFGGEKQRGVYLTSFWRLTEYEATRLSASSLLGACTQAGYRVGRSPTGLYILCVRCITRCAREEGL